MKSMTIPELYEYLCSPQFQDEHSGNIFYNYYIYPVSYTHLTLPTTPYV